MRMKDECGVVTAAGSGMGRAGAVRFAREGAAVAVVDIDADAVRAVVGEIESGGGRAVGIPADLTRDEDSRRILREAANAQGPGRRTVPTCASAIRAGRRRSGRDAARTAVGPGPGETAQSGHSPRGGAM